MKLRSKFKEDIQAGIDDETFIIKGSAVTEVDAELAAAWLKQHADIVRSGLIEVVTEPATKPKTAKNERTQTS